MVAWTFGGEFRRRMRREEDIADGRRVAFENEASSDSTTPGARQFADSTTSIGNYLTFVAVPSMAVVQVAPSWDISNLKV
jgi:hypothetical protein